MSIQKTFLRLLQEREYRPVGSSNHEYSDFRLVAATNRDLNERTAQELFREDLLFRLQATIIELPPLKERREDIRELATHFISTLCERYGLETKGVAPDFIETLMGYDWPGNVRELYQTMEQVFTSSLLGPTCFSIHLPEKFRIQQARAGFESQKKYKKYLQTFPPGVSIKNCVKRVMSRSSRLWQRIMFPRGAEYQGYPEPVFTNFCRNTM